MFDTPPLLLSKFHVNNSHLVALLGELTTKHWHIGNCNKQDNGGTYQRVDSKSLQFPLQLSQSNGMVSYLFFLASSLTPGCAHQI
jgi:hypothetical protein